MIESTMMFRKRSDARYRSVGGEGIVVRQSVGEVLVLNEVGLRVLDLLAPGDHVGNVVKALALEYEIDAPTLAQDVSAYVQELLDAGIIEQVAA
jgi:hypothetical protein